MRLNSIEDKLGEGKRHNRLRSIQVQQTGETAISGNEPRTEKVVFFRLIIQVLNCPSAVFQ